MKVRVKFSKYGALRFIGHLDVMRFFQKALRRAKLDVSYSAGFSPHQIMSFAQPLGVGMASLGEYMDIEMGQCPSMEEFVQRLNAQCPEGINVLEAVILPEKASNAMASVRAAAYAAAVKNDPAFFDGKEKVVETMLSMENLPIFKETKSGETEVNIRPGIYDLHIEDGKLIFTVNASSAGNIKPIYVTDHFLRLAETTVRPIDLQIIRLEMYTVDENEQLIPLSAVGEA